MKLVLANTGAKIILDRFLNNVAASNRNFFLRLYTNDKSTVQDTAQDFTSASFTEAGGGGYAAKELTQQWIVSTIADGSVVATYPIYEFSFTGTLTNDALIYGYYITDSSTTPILLLSQQLDTPFKPVQGSICSVTPTIRLYREKV